MAISFAENLPGSDRGAAAESVNHFKIADGLRYRCLPLNPWSATRPTWMSMSVDVSG
jgi:hypothetical protein